MSMQTEIFGDVVVVHAPDELTEDHARTFLRELAQLGMRRVIVDLDGAESIDSAGLELLLDAQDSLRGNAGDMRLVTSNHVNRKILEITRLDEHLEVFDSVIDAVKSFA
jgi:anti-anti-sigma factor